MISPRRYSTTALIICLLAAAGCKDREVVNYRAPKDPAPVAMPAAPAAAMSGQLPEGHPPIGGQAAGPGPMAAPVGEARFAAAPGNALTWTAPAHWQAKATSSFRKGSYNVPGEGGAAGDLAITAFPGDTGGLFANVNRWRGQIGLPPVAEAGLEAAIQRLDVNGFKIILVDATGTANGQPVRLLGAIVPHEGQTWFFKLSGPEAVVAKEQASFREFLSTIKAAKP